METWKCHICGKERPDDKISVVSRPIVANGQVIGQQNVRYCNDNADCIRRAQTFQHITYAERKEE